MWGLQKGKIYVVGKRGKGWYGGVLENIRVRHGNVTRYG